MGLPSWRRSSDANSDFNVRIFNPDGSEAGMSGNGTRCAAAYLHYHKLWSAKICVCKRGTASSVTTCSNSPAERFPFRSELGQPKFDSASIPMTTDEPLERGD